MSEEKVGRRSYVKYAGAGVVVVAVAAAGGYYATRPSGPGAPGAGVPPEGKYTWEEWPAEHYQAIDPAIDQLYLYIDYAAFSSPTIEAGFLRDTGINNINVDVYSDEMDAFAKVVAGGHGYDLLHFHYVTDPKNPTRPGIWRDYQINRQEGKLVEPLDMNVMSNFKGDFYPSTAFWEKTSKWNGEWYTIPHELFVDSLSYNSEFVTEDEASTIEVLWNPKFANKIAMPAIPIQALVIAGIYTGAEIPWNQTEAEIEKSKQALLEQKKLIRAYWTGAGDQESLFASKEVYVAWTWYAGVAKLIKEGFPVTFMMNVDEGVIVGACHHAVSAETKHKYEAMLWLNWNLSEERQCQMFLEAGYPPSSKIPYRNKEVFTDEVMELWNINRIDKVFDAGHYYSAPDLVDEYTKAFAEVQAA